MEKYPVFKTFLKEVNNALIIIFGSFAKFKADKNSDLDLMTLSKQKLPLHLLPYKIHNIEISKKVFEKSSETLIKEIEQNHIVLSNHSYYVNTMWDKYAK